MPLSRIRAVQRGWTYLSFAVIALVIYLTRPSYAISNRNGSTLLTKLSRNRDIHSRQQVYPQTGYYQSPTVNPFPPQYALTYPDDLPYPNLNSPYPYGPSPYPYPQGPLSPTGAIGSIRDSFVRTLESVAFNDELRCVPKLLCEVMAGNAASLTGRQNLLPFNLDMGSLLGMLSQLNLDQASPLLMFGRAVLLGYSSQRDPNACSSAYPQCPRDPDRLVQYLNNYNGGFFRYFNGLPNQSPQDYNHLPQYYNQLNPNGNSDKNPSYNTYANQYAQQRILTSNYNENVVPSFKSIKFPQNNDEYVHNYNSYSDVKLPLVFPEGMLNRDLGFRKGKTLFPEPAKFERPLPNHVASPLIFPVRTGTGDLILDTNSFFPEKNDYHRKKINYNIINNRLY